MANKTVAVVNDDTQFLRLMELVLDEAGYTTLIFSEGGTAFEGIKRHKPDLAVLDIRIEHPEGGWVILDLMRLDRETVAIPVIVCSADYQELNRKEEYLRSKGCRVLRKPFDIDDLITVVSDVIGPACA